MFGGFDKCRFGHNLCDYSILPGVHGMQEVARSNRVGSIFYNLFIYKCLPFDIHLLITPICDYCTLAWPVLSISVLPDVGVAPVTESTCICVEPRMARTRVFVSTDTEPVISSGILKT